MGIQGRIAWKLALAAIVAGTTSVANANEPEAVPGEYVVKLKANVRKSNIQSLSQALGSEIKSTIADDNIVVIRKSAIEKSSSVIKSLSKNPLVEVVEPNFIYRINRTPNDPSFGKLWGLQNTGQNDAKSAKAPGLAGTDIDVVRAWDITQGSDDVLVAVIDTGIDYNHPDLKENLWTNQAELNGQTGVDDDGNGVVDDIYGANFVDAAAPTGNPLDDHGHGSHCAGTIGARGDDGRGVAGVAWRVKLMGVKFLSAEGGGTLEGAILSVDYATRMGAKIMSNSWGGGGESQLLKEAIERANTAGSLFVAAAGNNASNNDTRPFFPAGYQVPNVLSVVAVDNQGALASFSNYGKRTTHIAAPGVNIYSTFKDGGYIWLSGTSMATPHVSGVAALLAAKESQFTNTQLKERLLTTATHLASVRSKTSSGGMVNAYSALTNQVTPPDPNDPANWAFQTVSISTAHPYARSTTETYEVKVEGANEISLYFSRFDTERGYDFVTVYDKNNIKVAELHGNYDESHAVTLTGDSAKLVFTSDDSQEKYGFDLTKVYYR